MKFGINEVIRPLSVDKAIAERTLWIADKKRGVVNKVATSVKIDDEATPLKECIAAIKELQAGNSDYTAIEFFTDSTGLVRMNICHMAEAR